MAKEGYLSGQREAQEIPVVVAQAVPASPSRLLAAPPAPFATHPSPKAPELSLENNQPRQIVPFIAESPSSKGPPVNNKNDDGDTCGCCVIICGSAAATAALVCCCCCILPLIIALVFLLGGNPETMLEDSEFWDG